MLQVDIPTRRELVLAAPDRLLRLEEQDRAVSEVEVDEMLRLCRLRQKDLKRISRRSRLTVRNETTEIPSHNAMPGRSFTLVELSDISTHIAHSWPQQWWWQTSRLM